MHKLHQNKLHKYVPGKIQIHRYLQQLWTSMLFVCQFQVTYLLSEEANQTNLHRCVWPMHPSSQGPGVNYKRTRQ